MHRKDFPKIAELLGKGVKQCFPAQPGVMFDITPQTPYWCCPARLWPFPSWKLEVTLDTVADGLLG